MSTTQEGYVTLTEAAQRTGLSRRSLTRRIEAGQLVDYATAARPRLRLLREADIEPLCNPEPRPRNRDQAVAGAAA